MSGPFRVPTEEEAEQEIREMDRRQAALLRARESATVPKPARAEEDKDRAVGRSLAAASVR